MPVLLRALDVDEPPPNLSALHAELQADPVCGPLVLGVSYWAEHGLLSVAVTAVPSAEEEAAIDHELALHDPAHPRYPRPEAHG